MKNRLALVTGSSSGLGYQLSQVLLENGWQVHGVSRQQGAMEHKGYTHHSIDLSQGEAVEEYFSKCLAPVLQKSWERIALVNNAGTIQPVGPIIGKSYSQLHRSLTLNFTSALWLMAFVLKQGEGRPIKIVNISSGAALKPYQGWGMYCSAKAALRMASQVTALEAGAQVLSYAPGVLDTPMQAQVRQSDPKDFPGVERFLDLYRKGALVDPALPAAELKDFLNQEFKSGEYQEKRFGESR